MGDQMFRRSKAQNRANVQQLKMIGQSHQTGLTPSLLKLFEPRPPLDHKPPLEKRKMPPHTGIAQFVDKFAEPGDPEYAPPVTRAETRDEKRARIKEARLQKGQETVQEVLKTYDPQSNPKADGDPYKTLFVARVSYETTEAKLRREFEAYGPIKKVTIVADKSSGKPRGYAFIEYHHTRDMKTAYKQADGRKIENRRVLVDVERGRTVPNWRPRRLGGGLGSTRTGGEEVNQKHSGRDPPARPSGTEALRERPSEREDRDRDRDRERDRGRSDYRRDRDRERERSRERSRERDRDREERPGRERERERDRDRDERPGRERERDEEKRERSRSASRGEERERDR